MSQSTHNHRDARTRLTAENKDALLQADTNYLCAVIKWNEADKETLDFIQQILNKRYTRTFIN